MKATSCDSVALSTDLFSCVIETKDELPQRDLEHLMLAIATAAPRLDVRDEQVLELP